MLSICVNSQTPLIRFRLSMDELVEKYGRLSEPLDVSLLKEGEDYIFSPGGVTKMVYPLLKEMRHRKLVENPCWVSLNTVGPPRAVIDGILLRHVILGAERMRGYGYVKETIWSALHGLQESVTIDNIAWRDEFADYVYYNRLCGEAIRKLDEENDFDLFYIHDFQQLPMGSMIEKIVPKVFRWHIPFTESLIPQDWRPLLLNYFNSYDAIIVSSKRYLDTLTKMGYRGRAYHVYPYIDFNVYRQPSKEQVEAFCDKFGIDENDRVVLVVARLDPMKGQDRAIKAMAKVKRHLPQAKLVLAGNGSFSSSREGLGLSKGERWMSRLRALAGELGVEENVVFTGYITHEELEAAYSRCDLTVLPSVHEGFGLVVVESWIYRKPAIVSSAAGIAELVRDNENGMIFDPDDVNSLAEKILMLLSDQELAERLALNGYEASKSCSLENGVKAESEILIGIASGSQPP